MTPVKYRKLNVIPSHHGFLKLESSSDVLPGKRIFMVEVYGPQPIGRSIEMIVTAWRIAQIYETRHLYAMYQPINWSGIHGYGCAEVERIINGPEVCESGIDIVYWKKNSC
jgi:hypothetical protein